VSKNDDFFVTKFSDHNHPEDATQHPLAEFNNNNLKRTVKTSGEPPCKIVKTLKVGANAGVVPFLSSDRSLKQKAYRHNVFLHPTALITKKQKVFTGSNSFQYFFVHDAEERTVCV
jgi:hypothetical protein